MSDDVQVKREILPIPDVPPMGLTTHDAKDPDIFSADETTGSG